MTILKVDHLEKNFGALAAVSRVSFSVESGERRALIGPNGAGKTTLFNLISGELEPSNGKVELNGQDITKLPPNERARLGMARTFQRNNLFVGLSVWENVRLAAHPIKSVGARVFGATQSKNDQIVRESLDRVGLYERRETLARNLSYGEQRQLELAIALSTQPKILLLDEPAAGMSPAETNRLLALLRDMPKSITILIIEHDMDLVFGLVDSVTVLHYGQVLASGQAEQVRNDPRVLEVYLGVTPEATCGL